MARHRHRLNRGNSHGRHMAQTKHRHHHNSTSEGAYKFRNTEPGANEIEMENFAKNGPYYHHSRNTESSMESNSKLKLTAYPVNDNHYVPSGKPVDNGAHHFVFQRVAVGTPIPRQIVAMVSVFNPKTKVHNTNKHYVIHKSEQLISTPNKETYYTQDKIPIANHLTPESHFPVSRNLTDIFTPYDTKQHKPIAKYVYSLSDSINKIHKPLSIRPENFSTLINLDPEPSLHRIEVERILTDPVMREKSQQQDDTTRIRFEGSPTRSDPHRSVTVNASSITRHRHSVDGKTIPKPRNQLFHLNTFQVLERITTLPRILALSVFTYNLFD